MVVRACLVEQSPYKSLYGLRPRKIRHRPPNAKGQVSACMPDISGPGADALPYPGAQGVAGSKSCQPDRKTRL